MGKSRSLPLAVYIIPLRHRDDIALLTQSVFRVQNRMQSSY